MAIGSDPEIGVSFSRWGDMNDVSRQAWFTHMRENWHPNLMAGYATLHYAPRGKDNPYYEEEGE